MTKEDRPIGIMYEICDERIAQDEKWGARRDHSFPFWYTILAEEFGEVGRAILEHDPDGMRNELIQTAAVAVAMIEALDRWKESGQSLQEYFEERRR